MDSTYTSKGHHCFFIPENDENDANLSAFSWKDGANIGGRTVHAFDVRDTDEPFFIASHQACNQVAECFIKSQETQHDTFRIGIEDQISPFKQLWQVLYYRMPGDAMPLKHTLPHPYKYYGSVKWDQPRGKDWQPDNQPDVGDYVEADPINIPLLTESILDNLEPLPSGAPSTDSESQDWWFERLTSRKEFGWLWDLDRDLVRERQRSGNWDWELLIKKLSQTCIHDLDDKTLSLPLGLRNRRRIWRCVEEARAGDTARALRPHMGFELE